MVTIIKLNVYFTTIKKPGGEKRLHREIFVNSYLINFSRLNHHSCVQWQNLAICPFIYIRINPKFFSE